MEPAKTQNEALSSSVADAHHEQNGFPQFQTDTFGSQILWLAISFGGLLYVMRNFVIPRISGILDHRNNIIQENLSTAHVLQQEAHNAVEAYQQKLSSAQEEASRLAQAMHEDAQIHAASEKAKLEKSLEKKFCEAEKHIHEAQARALKEVDDISKSIADEIVRKLIGDLSPVSTKTKKHYTKRNLK